MGQMKERRLRPNNWLEVHGFGNRRAMIPFPWTILVLLLSIDLPSPFLYPSLLASLAAGSAEAFSSATGSACPIGGHKWNHHGGRLFSDGRRRRTSGVTKLMAVVSSNRATVEFNKKLDALARSAKNDGGESAYIAESLLQRALINARRRCEDDDQQHSNPPNTNSSSLPIPDTVRFATVINAWSKSGTEDAPVKAEAILRQMDDGLLIPNAKPNTLCYTAVIDAWSKSGRRNAAQRAESILLEMQELYDSGVNTDVRPNSIAYCNVINAHARSGGGARGEEGGTDTEVGGGSRGVRGFGGEAGGDRVHVGPACVGREPGGRITPTRRKDTIRDATVGGRQACATGWTWPIGDVKMSGPTGCRSMRFLARVHSLVRQIKRRGQML